MFLLIIFEAYTTKTGKESSQLSMKQSKVNAAYLTQFLSDLLPSFIFHRNQLKYFRNVITSFRENFESLIDIDFSENSLKVWTTICSLESRTSNCLFKSYRYHSHLSDDRKHVFVVRLQRMLNPITPSSILVIESGNCASQYKNAAHFY